MNKILKFLHLTYKGRTIFERSYWRMLRDRRKLGFDESETWSLDYRLTEFIVPRLKMFIKIAPKVSIPHEFLNIEHTRSIEKGYTWDKSRWQLTDKRERQRCWERAEKAWLKTLNDMLAGFEDELLEEQDWDAWVKKWKSTVDKYNRRLDKAKTLEERQEIWNEVGYTISHPKINTNDVVYKMRQHSKDLLAKFYNDLWW